MSLQYLTQNTKLTTVGPNDSLKECASRMKEAEVGAIVVVENDKPVGIITDRDLVIRAIAEDRGFDEPVKEIMTKSPVTINAKADIQDLIEQMEKQKVRRVVIENNGKALGIVSSGDIEALLAEQFSKIAAGTCPKVSKLKKETAA